MEDSFPPTSPMKRVHKTVMRREHSLPKQHRHSYPPVKPTLGDLVQRAYHKNLALDANDARSLRTTLLQRHLWSRLQSTFFHPSADPDALAKLPLDSEALLQAPQLISDAESEDPSLAASSSV
eukprot:m.133562 g.133562  ORF g.133562 m.133562 type:complete len:123 (-) comp15952_c0_seq4:1111-1479(-)